MDVKVLTTPGLGDKSYVLAHEGSAIVVDPQRDIRRFTAVLEETGSQAHFVLETHLHNDYVSGGLELARSSGADLVLPAGAGTAFPYVPAFHLEDLGFGPITIRPIHTPGHTPEHVSYLILLDEQVVAVFSGGSLLVGSAGRTDLLGQDRARSLVRLQYRSVHRLAALPEDAPLYPTHGAGSFCTSSEAGGTASTIGAERRANPVLAYEGEDAFALGQLHDLPPYPAYYANMGAINVAGPGPIPEHEVPEFTPDEMAAAMDAGVMVVDARYKTSFAEGHIPGSWGIELGSDFAIWTGWLLPFDPPVALVLGADDSLEEAQTALARIGFDQVVGVMRGVEGWKASGRPTTGHGTITAREFVDTAEPGWQVVDVRAPTEWSSGTLDGSVLCHLPDLVASIPEQISRDAPVYVGCTTGHRASVAAGVLGEAGYEPVVMTGASLLGVVMLSAVA